MFNEYDVIHEYDINHFDVVRHRDVVRNNDHTTHRPDYCCPPKTCTCADDAQSVFRPMPGNPGHFYPLPTPQERRFRHHYPHHRHGRRMRFW